MNSSENSTQFVPMLDAINAELKCGHSLGKKVKFLDLRVPEPIARRTHQKSYRHTENSIRLGPNPGSGTTNGLLLISDILGHTYPRHQRKTKGHSTVNQIPEILRSKAADLNEDPTIPHAKYKLAHLQATNLEILLDMALENLSAKLGKSYSWQQYSCLGFEMYFEVPAIAKPDFLISKLEKYLNETYGIKRKQTSLSEGHEFEPDKWKIKFPVGNSNKIEAFIKLYRKGEYHRIELSLKKLGYMKTDSVKNFMSEIHSLVDYCGNFLKKLYDQLFAALHIKSYSRTQLDTFKKVVLASGRNKGNLYEMAQTLENQLISHGIIYKMKPDKLNRPLNRLIEKIVKMEILQAQKKNHYKNGADIPAKTGKIFKLTENWLDRAANLLKSKRKARKGKRSRRAKTNLTQQKRPRSLNDLNIPLLNFTLAEKWAALSYIQSTRSPREDLLYRPGISLQDYLNPIANRYNQNTYPNLSFNKRCKMNNWYIGPEIHVFHMALTKGSDQTQSGSSGAWSERSDQPRADSSNALTKPDEHQKRPSAVPPDNPKRGKGRKRRMSQEDFDQAYNSEVFKNYVWLDDDSLDIEKFCEKHQISKRTFHNYKRQMLKKSTNPNLK